VNDIKIQMPDTHIVVLAAGQGTRMKSGLPKVLHRIGGQSLIGHVLKTAETLEPATVTVIVGHQASMVREHLGVRQNTGFALQEPQLGTAHALQQAEEALAGRTGTAVLLSGDVPLLSAATLRRLVDVHRGAGAAATVVTATVERPYGYGRIVRSDGRIARIVEERARQCHPLPEAFRQHRGRLGRAVRDAEQIQHRVHRAIGLRQPVQARVHAKVLSHREAIPQSRCFGKKADARAQRLAAKAAAAEQLKAEQIEREAAEKAERELAEQLEHEARIAREAALEEEKKRARDERYAARKAAKR